jgi:hypothetical protein
MCSVYNNIAPNAATQVKSFARSCHTDAVVLTVTVCSLTHHWLYMLGGLMSLQVRLELAVSHYEPHIDFEALLRT